MWKGLFAQQTAAFTNCSGIEVAGGDPLGLFRRIKHFNCPGTITIFPNYTRISKMPLIIRKRRRSLTSGSPLGTAGSGQEIFGIREYRHGDPVRFIHWRASAKQRKLLVREFEDQGIKSVNIVLDIDRRSCNSGVFPENFEILVEIAASLIEYLAGIYCAVNFITAGNYEKNSEIISIAGTTFQSREKILRLLAGINPADIRFQNVLSTAAEYGRRDSMMFCLSMSNASEIYEILNSIACTNTAVRLFSAHKSDFGGKRRKVANTEAVSAGYMFDITPLDATSNLQQILK